MSRIGDHRFPNMSNTTASTANAANHDQFEQDLKFLLQSNSATNKDTFRPTDAFPPASSNEESAKKPSSSNNPSKKSVDDATQQVESIDFLNETKPELHSKKSVSNLKQKKSTSFNNSDYANVNPEHQQNRPRRNSKLNKKKSFNNGSHKSASHKPSTSNLKKENGSTNENSEENNNGTTNSNETEAADKQRKAFRNLKRKERRKKAAAYRKLERQESVKGSGSDGEGYELSESAIKKALGEADDIEFDDSVSLMSDDSFASGASSIRRIGKRSSSAPIKRSDSITSLDIDDLNVTLGDAPYDLDNIIADEKKRSVSDFLPPTPSFTPPKDLLHRKSSVSQLIQQHEGSSLNSKRSVSELIQQHGGGGNRTVRRDSLITPAKDLLNSRKKSVADLIAASSQEDHATKVASNPFEITLRPTKKQNLNGKFTSESLPQIHPIKTIIGLSHQQILNLDLTDVKIKTIVSSSKVSKFAQNALNFVIKQTGELFEDLEKKSVFFKLCINVALYESIGFRKSLRAHPEIIEWFGGYDEINLETTRTKLTPSNKDIHQNNFDYSVLSYFGHILIWALHHQRMGKVSPQFIENYDIQLSQSTTKSSVGGYHLWDRLIRESKGMNSKRWKHVIKFRQSFAYEEDQFMLMLRFMKVADTIP